MKIFADQMDLLLSSNAKRIDAFKKREYLYWKMYEISKRWEALGGRLIFSENYWGTFFGENKIGIKDFNILMDEYIFSDPRLEVRTSGGSTENNRLSYTVRDTHTACTMDFDLLKDSLSSCKVLKSTKQELKEIETLQYICGGD